MFGFSRSCYKPLSCTLLSLPAIYLSAAYLDSRHRLHRPSYSEGGFRTFFPRSIEPVVVPWLVPGIFHKSWTRWVRRWRELPQSRRTMYQIAGANVAVFLVCQSRSARVWRALAMHTSPKLFLPHTMLTSAFTHATPLHLMFNMIGLTSLGPHVHHAFTHHHFVAFYLSSAIVSSCTSYIGHRLQSPGTTTASVGASGCLCAALGSLAVINPDLQLSIIFVPGVQFPLWVGVGGMVLVDVCGILYGRSRLDHWGHLGGTFLGLTYTYFGGAALYVTCLKYCLGL